MGRKTRVGQVEEKYERRRVNRMLGIDRCPGTLADGAMTKYFQALNSVTNLDGKIERIVMLQSQ